jgi:hypothetical protein
MTAPALVECFKAVTKESGGLVAVHIFFPEDLRGLITRSLVGDREATMLVPLVRQGTKQIRSASRKAPALCGCCPRPIRSHFALAIVLPERSDPSQGFAIGLCAKCTEGDINRAHQKAVESLAAIWPDARPVLVTHPGGGRA